MPENSASPTSVQHDDQTSKSGAPRPCVAVPDGVSALPDIHEGPDGAYAGQPGVHSMPDAACTGPDGVHDLAAATQVAVTAPAPDPQAARAARVDRVSVAAHVWTRQLADVGGRNTLLWYRDSPLGTLDLSRAHPGGVAMLLTGRDTKLTDLIRDPDVIDGAAKRARAMAAKTDELRDERGLIGAFLAVGYATWCIRPGGGSVVRRPCAPVLVRGCRITVHGPAAADITLTLGPDIDVNPALRHYLSSECGIELDTGAIELLATSGGGFDPTPVYAALNQTCQTLESFSVSDRLVVSTFPQAKLPLVADLAAWGEALAEHDVVAALAGDPHASEALKRSADIVERTPAEQEDALDTLPIVSDPDAAQATTLLAAAEEGHLYIDAPATTDVPGLLTNLVAIHAAAGRSCLVLAQSVATRSAFATRMRECGLESLVLDLADGGIDRRRLAQEFAGALVDMVGTSEQPEDTGDTASEERHKPGRVGRLFGFGRRNKPEATQSQPALTTHSANPSESGLTAAQFERMRQVRRELQAHVDALHRRREPWGVTAYEIHDAIVRLAAGPVPPRCGIRFKDDVLASLNRRRLHNITGELTTLAELGAWPSEVGPDPWYRARVSNTDEVVHARDVVAQLVDGGLDQLTVTMREVFTGVRLPNVRSVADWGRFLEAIADVRETLTVFAPEIFDIPLREYVAATGTPEYREAAGVEQGWLERQRLVRQVRRYLRPGPVPENLHALLRAADSQRSAWHDMAGPGGRPELPVELDRAYQAYDTLADDLDWLEEHLPPRQGPPLIDSPIEDVRQLLIALHEHRARLDVVPLARGAISELDAAGLRPLVDDVAARAVAPDDVPREVEFAWWASLADEIHRYDPLIGGHSGERLAALVAEHRTADLDVLAHNATRVNERVVAHARAAVAAAPHAEQMLRDEAEKARAQLALHDLLPVMPKVLTALRPCWSVSPLAVAAVVPPRQVFDTVIVADAAALELGAAIPGLARARRVIVIGDEKQLPPTAFVTSAGADAPGDAAGFPGRESLADAVQSLLPRASLTTSVRQSESLIAFANSAAYEGRLACPPAPHPLGSITLETVHGQGMVDAVSATVETTAAEVDKVVALVLAHAGEHPDRSLGVITIGATHAGHVDDAVRRALASERGEGLREFFDPQRAEPFYVKTAEHAIDERDTIIFSIGYGKTPHGRVMHRFGLVSAVGGERALINALTRARQQLAVVSAVSADDLDEAKLKATGARMLREFLAFAADPHADPDSAANSGKHRRGTSLRARGGPARPTRHGGRFSPSPWESAGLADLDAPVEGEVPVMMADLAHRLEAHGLQVEHNVGASDPIEMVARRPGNSIAVAIESDGPAYARREWVRDRDRQRFDRLESLGWATVRVWTTDYFRDPARVVAAILDAVGFAAPEYSDGQ